MLTCFYHANKKVLFLSTIMRIICANCVLRQDSYLFWQVPNFVLICIHNYALHFKTRTSFLSRKFQFEFWSKELSSNYCCITALLVIYIVKFFSVWKKHYFIYFCISFWSSYFKILWEILITFKIFSLIISELNY